MCPVHRARHWWMKRCVGTFLKPILIYYNPENLEEFGFVHSSWNADSLVCSSFCVLWVLWTKLSWAVTSGLLGVFPSHVIHHMQGLLWVLGISWGNSRFSKFGVILLFYTCERSSGSIFRSILTDHKSGFSFVCHLNYNLSTLFICLFIIFFTETSNQLQ